MPKYKFTKDNPGYRVIKGHTTTMSSDFVIEAEQCPFCKKIHCKHECTIEKAMEKSVKGFV